MPNQTQPITSATFTPPDDLQPAIDMLTPVGRKLLDLFVEANGGNIQPRMIALAADLERHISTWQT